MKNPTNVGIRIITFALTIILLIGLLAACGGSKAQQHLYDDDSRIAEQGDSYTYATKADLTENEHTNARFSGFSGADTVWYLEVGAETTIHMQHNLDIRSGKLKLVLVAPDDRVTVISDQSGEGNLEIPLDKGNSRIKLVGQKASGSFKASIVESSSPIEITTAEW